MPWACAASTIGLHFVEGDGLCAVDVFEAAARAKDLDPICARFHALVDKLSHVLRIRWSTLPRRHTGPRGDDARTNHRARPRQLAHGEVRVARRIEIAHGRDTRFQRAARVVLRQEHGHRRQATLTARASARRAVPVIGDVRVQIDQRWQTGKLPEVNHLGARGHIVPDGNDAGAINQDDGVSENARTVPELAEADGARLRRHAPPCRRR